MLNKITRLKNHQGFKKYFANTSWFFVEKILRIIVGLFVGIWVARYLGPEKFGILSYVGAFIGLFVPISKLGFDGIIQRDIVKNEKDIDYLLNSAIFFKLIGSFFIVFFTTFYMYIQNKEEIYIYITFILSLVYLFKSFEVIEFYFRAKVKAKYISISNSIAMIFSALFKIILICLKFSLLYFALANLIEVFVAIILITIFFKKEPYKLDFTNIKIIEGIKLLKESWPLIFSGFFALIYLNIDQVMIEEMLNSFQVGEYSAAVRISSAFYFIPLTIGWSIQTAVVNAKKKSEKLYYERLELISLLMAIGGYLLIIPISFFAKDIMLFLFGIDYIEAGNILTIHVWAGLFLFMNVIRSLWIITEGEFKLDLYGNILAGVLNICLNFLLIPEYGIMGAAIATLISYSITYVFFGLFYSAKSRKIAIIQLKSLFLLNIKVLRNFK